MMVDRDLKSKKPIPKAGSGSSVESYDSDAPTDTASDTTHTEASALDTMNPYFRL